MSAITWTQNETALKGQVDEKSSISEIELEISKLPVSFKDVNTVNIIFTNNTKEDIKNTTLQDTKIMFPDWIVSYKDNVITINIKETVNKL